MRYLCALLLATLLASLIPTPAAAAESERCFPATGHCISGVIRSYWERNGGLRVFGYPITDVFNDEVEGTWYGPVQWFERDRLEDHSDQGLGVLAGRLGAALLTLQGRAWEHMPHVDGAPAGCRFFPQTGHSLCGTFLRIWQDEGGLSRFGYPLSEPLDESLMDGDNVWTGTVQYFERRRLELHPDLAGTPYEVLLGLLGSDIFAYAKVLKCGHANSPLVPLAGERGYSCAASLPRLRTLIATQPFEHGTMIWLSGTDGYDGVIYAIYAQPNTGVLLWESHPDAWGEGVPVPDVGQPPPGLQAPAHGFGLLWATNADLRAALGWATAPEQADRGDAQLFHINSGPGSLRIITNPAVSRTFLLYTGMPAPNRVDQVEVLMSVP